MLQTSRTSILILACLVGTGCVTAGSISSGDRAAIEAPTQFAPLAAGTYLLGPENAEVLFSVRAGGVGRVEGIFADFNAVLNVTDPDRGVASLTADVETTSLQTNSSLYQSIVLGPAWFNVEKYPHTVFSGMLEGWNAGPGQGTLAGELTIKDQRGPASFDLVLSCPASGTCDGRAADFTATTKVVRKEFGLVSMPALVGDTVTLEVRGRINQTARLADE